MRECVRAYINECVSECVSLCVRACVCSANTGADTGANTAGIRMEGYLQIEVHTSTHMYNNMEAMRTLSRQRYWEMQRR